MGIRGLTTFIQNRSHLYMERYELHDTNLVIDGNAITCQLYKWHCKSNDCFGGDYDKFANVVHNFFKILADCNVTSYVVFDGGYENRKVATVISRMKNKIKSAEQLNSTTEGSISVFPLLLRETFQDIVLNLNVKCVRCDFEGDTEIATISRTLNCPVLSYDSDFFIFDVLYIPFSTFEMCVRKQKISKSMETYTFISCEVYKVEKFLKTFGGLDKKNLPIFAVLAGNDYIKKSVFSLFFNHLKIQKCHGNQNDQQKRIKSLVIWLQNETTESAIRKVLSRYKSGKRKLVAEQIENAIKGYYCLDSVYLKYLGISPDTHSNINLNMKNITLAINDDDQPTDVEQQNDTSSDSDEESKFSEKELEVSSRGERNSDIPLFFLDNFRKCLYPSCFMDLIVHNKYYCIPQVDNNTVEHSHSISLEILTAIHKILTNSTNNLICISRNEMGQIKKHVLPLCEFEIPSVFEIQNMDLKSKKEVLTKVLRIDENFLKDCLNLFPESWQLFILTIKYLANKLVINLPLIYSLILCGLILKYVDYHVGFCRSTKFFQKKFSKVVENSSSNIKEKDVSFKDNIKAAVADITYFDSLLCLMTVVSNFQMDEKMKVSSRLFDRNLIHSMAQFQSCFLHIKYLNCVLNFPYQNVSMSTIFNGTFIYNLTSNLKKRSNLNDYIKILLRDSPMILNSLKLMVDKIEEYTDNTVTTHLIKRRKKKKKQRVIYAIENTEVLSEEESVFDPNNKFALLSIT